MQTQKSFHICDARPTGGKAGKGNNKTSTVQVFDDTDPDCALLVKMFRFKVGNLQSYVSAKIKARKWVSAHLTQPAPDAGESAPLQADFFTPADSTSQASSTPTRRR